MEMKQKPKVVVIKVAQQALDPDSTAAHEIYQEVAERVFRNSESHDGDCTVPKKTGTES
jgi:hypothetical protein